MTVTRRTSLKTGIAALAAAGSVYACSTFFSGDSTVWQAQEAIGIDGNATPGCGWSETQGWVDRLGFLVAESCIVDYKTGLPSTDTLIVAGVSIHDVWADAPTENGPWTPAHPRADGYLEAHEYLTGLGYRVAWVAAPPAAFGPWTDLNDELASLNTQVAGLLGCELVSYQLRVDARYDGVHYTEAAAARVGERLAALDYGDACR